MSSFFQLVTCSPLLVFKVTTLLSFVRLRIVQNLQNKTYTAYEVEVTQGRLKWTIFRRYSEFVTLHKSIKVTAAAQLKALGPISATTAGSGAQSARGTSIPSSSARSSSSCSLSSGSANHPATAGATNAAGIAAAAAGIIDRYNLPKLPPKTRGRGRFSDSTVDLREQKLGDYLSALLQQPGATESVRRS